MVQQNEMSARALTMEELENVNNKASWNQTPERFSFV